MNAPVSRYRKGSSSLYEHTFGKINSRARIEERTVPHIEYGRVWVRNGRLVGDIGIPWSMIVVCCD